MILASSNVQHPDVFANRFKEAEFAADLFAVDAGRASKGSIPGASLSLAPVHRANIVQLRAGGLVIAADPYFLADANNSPHFTSCGADYFRDARVCCGRHGAPVGDTYRLAGNYTAKILGAFLFALAAGTTGALVSNKVK